MVFSNQQIYRILSKREEYDFPKPLSSVKIGRGDKGYELLELYCGFDIETTTITTSEGDHQAFAYHMQLTIGTPRKLCIYLFRKWEHLLHFIEKMADYYNLGEDRHAIIAIANMSFEFQFIRKHLFWDDNEYAFFAKEKYQPLLATYRGIEFREVLSITGGSLAQLAKDYCTTQKLITYDDQGNKISDLDYSKLRNSTTPLTDLEEQYCINDVVILSEFMWYMFNEYIRHDRKVPMTFTGILHREFKLRLKEMCKSRDKKYHLPAGASWDEWLNYIYSLQPSEDEYSFYMRYLFRGGYVHANALYTGVDGLLAKMKDITSHYPSRMNLDYYPMTPFKSFEWSEDACNKYCVIFRARFFYIRNTTTHSIESRNKIIAHAGASWDNGRLLSADFIDVYLTEKDYRVYKMFYTWQDMEIVEAKKAKRGKLPSYILDVLNDHYRIKEQLKRSGLEETTEYAIAKARVNTCYGDLVKRLRLEKVEYSNTEEWHDSEVTVDYDKEIRKAITSPFWGIYVTSAARLELCTIIYKLTKAGVPCYYGDTDSSKYKPCHKAEQIFKHYNHSIYRHRKNRKLRSQYFDGLGEFSNECKGQAVPFKTLGAKRYIYIYENKIYATVAGMPKASVYQIGKTPEEVLQRFNMCGYHLTADQSGKLTTQYTNEEYSAVIDGETMTELSGVALYKIPFTLNITSEYTAHVTELQEEYKREVTHL